MIKHLIKVDGELFEIPLKVYNHLEKTKQRADELESLIYTYKENAKSIPDLIEQIQVSNKRADEAEKEYDKVLSGYIHVCDEIRKYKLRADELEKRWSELVDVLKKKYEYYKVRADDESVGLIEQDKWKIAKHELMMVLKIMTDLKRGETE
ncbi:hypothetical protein MRN59_05735 [Macrococcoides caseolyticum]|uniref:hypothetical protein n=1 Tax=Macrococcoides caseolyticum TaxID=69966 RepID=UPI00339D3B49